MVIPPLEVAGLPGTETFRVLATPPTPPAARSILPKVHAAVTVIAIIAAI